MQVLPIDLANFLSKYLYLVITFVVLQGSLTFLLIFLFVDKLLSARKVKAEELLAKQDAYEESVRILNESKSKASEHILAAQDQSTKIIRDTNYLNETLQKTFDDELKQLVSRQEKAFNDVAANLSTQFTQAFEQEKITTLGELSKVSEHLRTDMLGKVDEFKGVLEKNTLEAENELREKIQADYQELTNKLKEYEAVKTKQIDDKMYAILTQVTKDILESAMSMEEHEELVFKLLNNAKIRQNF